MVDEERTREVVTGFVDAVNRHDIDSIVERVHPTIHISFAGLTPFEGKERVRSYFEWFAGYGARWDLDIVNAEPGHAHCRLDTFDRWSEIAGISPLRYSRVDFDVDGELVARIETEFTDSSSDALGRLLESFTPWAIEHYPELYTDDGDYDYSFSNGARMVDVMRQWRAGTGEGPVG